jgi:hypothetical protein
MVNIVISERKDAFVSDVGGITPIFKQIGKGLILFNDNGLHTVENGEVNKDIKLKGCTLFQKELHTGWGDNTYMGYYFVGESYSGEVWKLWIHRNEKFTLDHDAKKIKIELDRSQVVQLIRGLTFQELVAQVTEAEREREMKVLRADADFGIKARTALEQIRVIDAAEGRESRKKVRAILASILDGVPIPTSAGNEVRPFSGLML